MSEAQIVSEGTEQATEETAQSLALLAANEDNIAKTARELKITPYQLRKLRQKFPETYEAARRLLVNDIYDKTIVATNLYADELVRRIEDEETLDKMSVKEVAVTFGILVDKTNVMTTVRGKFGDAQKQAEGFGSLTEEELQEAIDADFEVLSETPEAEEPTNDESVLDTPTDELPVRPSGVPATGPVLHSGSDTG